MNFIIYNNQAVSVTYNGQVIAANSSYTAVDSAILGFANDPSLAVDVQAGNTGVSLTSASSAQITNAAGISLINNLILALSSVSSPLPANAAQESGGHLASLDSKFAVDGSGNLKAVVENFPSTQPVSLASLPLPANAAQESGGHLASLDSKLSIDGSGNLKAVVENFPSIQSIKPASNRLSGSLNGLGQTFVIATSGYGTATFQLTGTYVATLVVEASLDGTNYFSVVSYNYDGAPATPGLVVVSCASFEFVQLRVFAYTSGTVNIVAQADVGSNIMQVFQPESSYNFFVQASQADDSKPWLVQSVSNNVSINLNALGQTFVVSTAGYG
ncbi:MAG TPA: hypothetical protein VN855_00170, partial [Candidatus Acidoferrum sp.]|nr:hypothetical protein [Candidatus Acidoferrum sp.]